MDYRTASDWLSLIATDPKPHPITQVMPNLLEMAQVVGQSGYNMADRVKQASEGRMYGPGEGGAVTEDMLNLSVMGAPTAFAANRTAGPFYSALKGAVENAPINKGTGEQWAGTIRNMPGVKQEELDWTGFQDFLKSKPSVTKQEASDFLDANKVDVQEVVKGGVTPRDLPKMSDYAKYETKFSQYQLPGGENYRELLLTMPDKYDAALARSNKALQSGGKPAPEDIAAVEAGSGPRFQQSHYDEPNVLAHVRFNDRVVPGKNETIGEAAERHFGKPWKELTDEQQALALRKDGPVQAQRSKDQKVLFIEEIQSDWHQKGRKQGYARPADTKPRFEVYRKERPDIEEGHYTFNIRDLEGDRGTGGYADEGAARRHADQLNRQEIEKRQRKLNSVPDAPFKTSWPELSLKRMIKYAVDNGYDSVSWTPGKVQAERYDLSKQIDTLHWNESNNTLIALKDGKTVLTKQASKSDLPDFVGKDVAEKLVAAEPAADIRTLTGQQLQVGGEGMNAFYDKMLPAAANKLGKKYGAKVGVTRIASKPKASAAQMAEFERLATPEEMKGLEQEVWSLPITDAMRKEVGEKGVPLFAGGNYLGPLLGNDE
jgi:hypothetical protein